MSVVKNGAEISTPKKIAFICLTLGIALAVAVLIAEVVLRSFFIATPVKVSVDAKQYATIPGIYQPISTTTSRIKPNLPHDITINSLGYRGTDFSAAKPDGELRIFMAGDSFIFGDLVNDDQTLPHYLETTLRDECQKVRVVNGAMAGATITAHAALIKKAIAIKPDIVVLSFHDNDLVDLQSPVWNILEKNRSLRETFPFNLHVFFDQEFGHLRLGKKRLRAPARGPGHCCCRSRCIRSGDAAAARPVECNEVAIPNTAGRDQS